jgi:molybdopterin/thiamine biosynthesis adenylyltransferase
MPWSSTRALLTVRYRSRYGIPLIHGAIRGFHGQRHNPSRINPLLSAAFSQHGP